MVLGRVVGGGARALFYMASAQPYSVALWASAYIVETIPGIVLHILVVPTLVLVLMKAGLTPARYAPAGKECGA